MPTERARVTAREAWAWHGAQYGMSTIVDSPMRVSRRVREATSPQQAQSGGTTTSSDEKRTSRAFRDAAAPGSGASVAAWAGEAGEVSSVTRRRRL
jgi:hypothetical protein